MLQHPARILALGPPLTNFNNFPSFNEVFPHTCPQEERQEPDAEFKPNLVNSVCFLVNWIIQVTTFAVNYVGHPFNTALLDNKGMAMCVR